MNALLLALALLHAPEHVYDCGTGNAVRGLRLHGAPICASSTTAAAHAHPLSDIDNPAAAKTFTMTTRPLRFLFTAPLAEAPNYEGAFNIEASGAFTGDLLHLHQFTGNPGAGSHLLHAEANDPDVHAVHAQHNDANGIALHVVGKAQVDGTLNVSTNISADGGGVYAAADMRSPSYLPRMGANPLKLRGWAANGASAVGVQIQNVDALTTAGAKIAAFYPDDGTTEKASIDKDGYIVSAGSPVGRKVAVPATATTACAVGDFAANATHVYVCQATDSWVRTAAASW